MARRCYHRFFILTKDRPEIESLSITAKDNIYEPLDSAEDSSYYYNLLHLDDDSIGVDQQVVDMMSQLNYPATISARVNDGGDAQE